MEAKASKLAWPFSTPRPWAWREVELVDGTVAVVLEQAKDQGLGKAVLRHHASTWTPNLDDRALIHDAVNAYDTHLALLKEVLTTIVESYDGERDPFGMACEVCDGALPTQHSLVCEIRTAVREAEKAS